ncbi:cyclopropane-fatty-acyl-phospholipid synthase [Candidatus Berkelbacteria bacterium RIFCSPHIGHO2_12_FULL_36_9]|uniref:Cyclopropane-fatty-acyl-phospholipid synthase n=1 Tax=Candidatus Berkelbacteria bacterium RIFCSPHIGHO2_12_FULL_36_9 TaxID=1797469 RepID=A0A1F5EJF6_9BACT|nr:MAG: cyclopropane-fatty-acyl-phospholipid synthase [Candidatus Berkelbacteria bacterium RIFCSPHIGHO2_12_FULL_36_9]
MFNNYKKIVEEILAKANIKINGKRPWDLKVNDERLYQRIFRGGVLPAGEAYMDGWWDCKKIDELVYRLLRSNLIKKVNINSKLLSAVITSRIFNFGAKSKAFEIGKRHYDLGNDLFESMLDKRLVYTCGYWKKAKNLDQAQEAKLDLICKKIGLKRGQKILDIGCGWGSFAKFAAEKYGAKVVGITVSKEQVELGKKLCKGLPVKIHLQDYRDVNGKFDHIVSLGMFEHVGYKNYRTYMQIAARCLKDNGLFLLHTIGGNSSVTQINAWIEKYIFPNGMIPSLKQIGEAVEGFFVLEDLHNFGTDYDQTLMAWYNNFVNNWHKIKNNYDERFYRMWKLYLLGCAGSFRARNIHLWQIVFSKNGIKNGYQSIR